jgi:hypothetical protein
VFLHAPNAHRIARVREVYRLDDAAAAEAVRDSDRNRSRFIHQLTGAPWGSPGSYDISLDTAALGRDAAAEIVLAAAMTKKLLIS